MPAKNTKATKNNPANVSPIKGVQGGYMFVAPVGTPGPKTLEEARNAAFTVLGFISEDGYTETQEKEKDTIKDMNGSDVVSVSKSFSITAKFKPLEVKKETLAMYYGSENVTDENGVISTVQNSNDGYDCAVLLELLMAGNRRARRFIPHVSKEEIGDLVLNSAEVYSREVTVKYLVDGDGNLSYEKIASTETSPAGV